MRNLPENKKKVDYLINIRLTLMKEATNKYSLVSLHQTQSES